MIRALEEENKNNGEKSQLTVLHFENFESTLGKINLDTDKIAFYFAGTCEEQVQKHDINPISWFRFEVDGINTQGKIFTGMKQIEDLGLDDEEKVQAKEELLADTLVFYIKDIPCTPVKNVAFYIDKNQEVKELQRLLQDIKTVDYKWLFVWDLNDISADYRECFCETVAAENIPVVWFENRW